MVGLGYALSSEEHPPGRLVDDAVHAEEAGFTFAVISDHFHPWTTAQGQSPFVWSVLGAIAARTERLVLGTGVTCPTIRIHPAVIAQAAATTYELAEGRFFLGVGTGERLNEHIFGDPWPPPPTRREMLAEAIEVMRELWAGELVNHQGLHYTVDRARLYTAPSAQVPIFVAAGGPSSARLASEAGDGLMATTPNVELVEAFGGGSGAQERPRVGQVLCCWAESESEGRETVLRQWPNAAMGGGLGQELGIPEDYESVAKLVRLDDLDFVPCGPDPQPYIEAVRQFVEAGYDQVYVHQVGHQQAEFIEFWRREVMPEFASEAAPIVRAVA